MQKNLEKTDLNISDILLPPSKRISKIAYQVIIASVF